MAFNRSMFLREVRVFVLVALFIFLLTAFGLFTQTVDFVLSLQTMETSAYMEYYDSNYDKDNDGQIKEVITRLENDETAALEKHIFVFDKGDSSTISTSLETKSEGVKEQIDSELTAQSNHDFIFIDLQCCRTVDLDHYKVLVQVSAFPVYEQFFYRVVGFGGRSLAILAFVILVLFILRFKILGDRRKVNIVVSSVVMFCFIATFSIQALQTEMNGLGYFAYQEKATVISDLDFVCNGEYNGKTAELGYLEEITKDLTNNSISIQEIKFDNLEAFKANGAATGVYDVANSVDIIQDKDAIQSKKNDLYIKAALMLLLAFILISELYAKRGASFIDRQENKGITPAILSRDDIKLKYILFIVGIATACFSLVNVLRIREVAMLNWTENVNLMIDLIFTIALIATLVSSFFSSTILKKCGNLKVYIIAVCAMSLIGAALCGSSNNPVIFVIGLVIINTGIATIKMTDDLYTTLIDDIKRKDACHIQLESGRSIGEVVGTIAGGVISVMASYAFVQFLVSIVFLAVIVATLGVKTPQSKKEDVTATSFKEIFSSMKNVFKHRNASMYLLCVCATGSIPYMLIEYKLPLDIAALGLSAMFLSFIKVILNMITIYAKPLFHVISRYVPPLEYAVLYRLLDALVILFYLSSSSIIGMSIAVLMSGLLDGVGMYAVLKAFREHPELEEIPESDRLVVNKVVCKSGDAVSPTLFSTIQNPFVLSGIAFALPLAYYLCTKRKQKRAI